MVRCHVGCHGEDEVYDPIPTNGKHMASDRDELGIAHFVVSRMASERFPGKALACLYGKPMVEWIVDKALSIPVSRGVCIVACDDPRDDPLEGLAYRKGIKCARGPQSDFSEQYEEAVRLTGCTHWVEWSGDSPFADVRIAERILGIIHEKPEAWSYAAGKYPSGTTGIAVSGSTVRRLAACRAARSREDVKAHMAKGWPWYSIPNVAEETKGEDAIAHVDDLFDGPKSLFSMCIDYPLQLDFFNRICRYIGHFPTWEEIVRAHREMRL